MGRPAKYPAEGTLWNWVKLDRGATERASDPDALSESERDELKRLRKKAAQQEIGPGDLAEGSRLFREGDEPVIGFRFVDDHKADYTIVDLCRVGRCRA